MSKTISWKSTYKKNHQATGRMKQKSIKKQGKKVTKK